MIVRPGGIGKTTVALAVDEIERPNRHRSQLRVTRVGISHAMIKENF
jgi:hypothetical protein